MNHIQNLFSLENKSAIVTGANTGLGQGISIALAAAGAHVFGVARRSCEETSEKVHEAGGQFTEIIADLSDMAAIEKALEEIQNKEPEANAKDDQTVVDALEEQLDEGINGYKQCKLPRQFKITRHNISISNLYFLSTSKI